VSATRELKVEGTVDPRFDAVAATFRENFTFRGDVGAAVCIHFAGRAVVDLAGGFRDAPSSEAPYDHATLQLGFSTTKGVVAILVHMLAERRVLDLDEPVATFWPAFAGAGKEGVPVRWLLTHEAGLPALHADLTLEQLLAEGVAADAIAAQAPDWTPGSAHGYHAFTFGWLVGEVVRRAHGTSLGELVAEQLAAPLGLDLHLGLPASEHHRVSPMRAIACDLAPAADLDSPAPPDPALTERALVGPRAVFTRGSTWNSPEVWSAQWPSANAVLTARALSRLYAATLDEVDGVRLLAPETVAAAARPAVSGLDRVLGIQNRFGTGFQCSAPGHILGGDAGFGHSGAGGSLGFADPANGVAFGYATNRARPGFRLDPRVVALISAFYGCLS
jgi:CubicO group peptidase (beta-lactamase class C family)